MKKENTKNTKNTKNKMKEKDIIESPLAQSMEDIFREQSPEAKKAKKLEKKIEDAKYQIKNVVEALETPDDLDQEITKFLEIFIGPAEIKRAKDKMIRQTPDGKVSYCYSMLVNKIEKLDQMKAEIENILLGI